MGQAKRRGSLEQRIASAKERDAKLRDYLLGQASPVQHDVALDPVRLRAFSAKLFALRKNSC